MVKLPTTELDSASSLGALLGTTPWHPVGTYQVLPQYSDKKSQMKVEVVHESGKGLEGTLGIVGANEAIIAGPQIGLISEDYVAEMLAKKANETFGFDKTPKWKRFQFQNYDAVKEIYAGITAYRLAFLKK